MGFLANKGAFIDPINLTKLLFEIEDFVNRFFHFCGIYIPDFNDIRGACDQFLGLILKAHVPNNLGPRFDKFVFFINILLIFLEDIHITLGISRE